MISYLDEWIYYELISYLAISFLLFSGGIIMLLWMILIVWLLLVWKVRVVCCVLSWVILIWIINELRVVWTYVDELMLILSHISIILMIAKITVLLSLILCKLCCSNAKYQIFQLKQILIQILKFLSEFKVAL